MFIFLTSLVIQYGQGLGQFYYPMQSNLNMTYQMSNNYSEINLNFSNPLYLNSSEFQATMSLSVIGMDSNLFTWRVRNPPLLSPKGQAQLLGYSNQGLYDTYVIEIYYLENFFFENMVIRFVAPYSVCSWDQSSYISSEYQMISFSIGPYIQFSQLQNRILSGIKGTTIATIILAFLLYLFYKVYTIQGKKICRLPGIGRTLNLWWCLMDSIQILNLFLYLNAEITQQVRQELRVFNYLNFNFNYDFWMETYINNDSNLSLSLRNEGIRISFLQNTLVQWVLLGATILLTFLSMILLKSKGVLAEIIEYSFLIRVSSISICSVSLALTISFGNLSFSTQQNQWDFAFSILGLIWIVLYFVICFYALNHRKDQSNVKFQLTKFNSLFDGVFTKAIFKRNIYLLFDLRRVLFAAIYILLYDKQNTCVSILIVIQMIFIMILTTKFPFRISAVNLSITISELLFTTILVLLGCTVYMDFISAGYFRTSTRNNVGWLTTSCIFLICCIKCVGMFLELIQIKKLGFINKTLFQQEDKNQDEQQQIELVQLSNE